MSTDKGVQQIDRRERTLDAELVIETRVAGIERGRIKNAWVDCPYEVRPVLRGSGFDWEATFRALDDIETPGFTMRGTEPTRMAAKGQCINKITQQIKERAEAWHWQVWVLGQYGSSVTDCYRRTAEDSVRSCAAHHAEHYAKYGGVSVDAALAETVWCVRKDDGITGDDVGLPYRKFKAKLAGGLMLDFESMITLEELQEGV